MLDFKIINDTITQESYIETSISGKQLLTIPQLNKGTAYTHEERRALGLLGKLPNRVETLEEQVERAYLQFSGYATQLQQHIYLNNLHDKNQILFYKLLSGHLSEMLPIIYTPIVGMAVKAFSREYRQPRGLYISHNDQDQLDEILSNRSNPHIDLIVVTDGEGVLGIGDQGIGGMDIPVAKLMVYSLCGGIDPTRTLPIFLDVGTNNLELLQDPMYLGCRHQRIYTKQYDQFIEKFVTCIKKKFPHAFLHWEDLGRDNARRLLDKYQNQLCTFNDDIQGTGAVTLAALLAGCHVTSTPLYRQRIIIFGAGSAGTGICDQILDAMVRQGIKREEALLQFWLFDRQGLLLANDPKLTPAQKPYARQPEEIVNFPSEAGMNPTLKEAIHLIKPTILIGCSAQAGAFTEKIIRTMALNCERPIIFPLSNPDERSEANPGDLLSWTEGKALIATGTAFNPVQYLDRVVTIAQCNNALIFPGIGLGLFAVKANRLTSSMMWAAAQALSEFSPSKEDAFLPLLPSLSNAQKVAKHIAVAVAKEAIATKLAQCNQNENIEKLVKNTFWEPRYLPFKVSTKK